MKPVLLHTELSIFLSVFFSMYLYISFPTLNFQKEGWQALDLNHQLCPFKSVLLHTELYDTFCLASFLFSYNFHIGQTSFKIGQKWTWTRNLRFLSQFTYSLSYSLFLKVSFIWKNDWMQISTCQKKDVESHQNLFWLLFVI